MMEVMGKAVDADEPASLDVAILVPSWTTARDWKHLDHLYVPQRPKVTSAGARIWLCHEGRFFYSYRIVGFLLLDGSETLRARPLGAPEDAGSAARPRPGVQPAGARGAGPKALVAASPAPVTVTPNDADGPSLRKGRTASVVMTTP